MEKAGQLAFLDFLADQLGGKELAPSFRIVIAFQIKMFERLILFENAIKNLGQVDLARTRRTQESENCLGLSLFGLAEGQMDKGVHHFVDGIVLVENNLFQFSAKCFKVLELILFWFGRWQAHSPSRISR